MMTLIGVPGVYYNEQMDGAIGNSVAEPLDFLSALVAPYPRKDHPGRPRLY